MSLASLHPSAALGPSPNNKQLPVVRLSRRRVQLSRPASVFGTPPVSVGRRFLAVRGRGEGGWGAGASAASRRPCSDVRPGTTSHPGLARPSKGTRTAMMTAGRVCAAGPRPVPWSRDDDGVPSAPGLTEPT